MWWLTLTLTLISTLSPIQSTSYSSLDLGNADYQDEMMQSLYKRLSQLDQGYFKEPRDFEEEQRIAEDSELPGDDYAVPSFSQQLARSRGQADIRDSEYLEHSANAANGGYIYVTGGAGEGKQHLTPEGIFNNVEQVKSDESLPFYCHPPNPCPKGYTSENGCQEFIEDTAEEQQAWIEKMQQKGLCSCDEEHMFNCPKGQSIVSKVTDDVSGDGNSRIDDVINNILKDKSTNPYSGGQKRQSLVAKKSPRVKRSVKRSKMESELEKLAHSKRNSNPYLEGEKLRTVAKKGFTDPKRRTT